MTLSECLIYKDFIEWRYGDLSMLGFNGKCDTPLGSFEKLCLHPDLEFGKVKSDNNGLFLGAFSATLPAVGIDIVQREGRGRNTSIMAYSLNSKKTKELIEFIEKKSGFKRESSDPEGFDELATYGIAHRCLCSYDLLASSATRIPFERMFARFHYAHFLERNKGLSYLDALKIAEKNF